MQNEVRKERWWRKRNPPLRGYRWREANGYDKEQALSHGAFALIPEWSHDDTGDAGAPTQLQEQIAERNLQLITQVYEAAVLVQKVKQFEPSAGLNETCSPTSNTN